jgi:hypothetical protein
MSHRALDLVSVGGIAERVSLTWWPRHLDGLSLTLRRNARNPLNHQDNALSRRRPPVVLRSPHAPGA